MSDVLDTPRPTAGRHRRTVLTIVALAAVIVVAVGFAVVHIGRPAHQLRSYGVAFTTEEPNVGDDGLFAPNLSPLRPSHPVTDIESITPVVGVNTAGASVAMVACSPGAEPATIAADCARPVGPFRTGTADLTYAADGSEVFAHVVTSRPGQVQIDGFTVVYRYHHTTITQHAGERITLTVR